MPYLVNNDPLPSDGRERLQSVADRERFDDTTKCILCAACTTSCPSFWANGEYIGPAAIVQAHRFIFDTRDQLTEERLAVMNDEMGVWRCRTAFNCVEACPREINITKAIAEVKNALVTGQV
jgi:succinate dehydrogenase / fumarate reductase iron-sulfur subunit